MHVVARELGLGLYVNKHVVPGLFRAELFLDISCIRIYQRDSRGNADRASYGTAGWQTVV